MRLPRFDLIIRMTLVLGLVLSSSAVFAKDWTHWARYVGPSEKNQAEAVKELNKIENLDEILIDQIGTPNQSLALDTISTLRKDHLIPELLNNFSNDPYGFLILTVNSLTTKENTRRVFPQYKELLETKTKTLKPAHIVAMLEPLGRLGERLELQTLELLLTHPYPEVRESVLLYARSMILRYQKVKYHSLFYQSRYDKTYQIRHMVQYYLEDLNDHPLVFKQIPRRQLFRIKTKAPQFKKVGHDLRVVFGYKDARPSRFVGDRHERLALVQKLLSPCRSSSELTCDFFRHANDGDLLLKRLPSNGKRIMLRVAHSSVSTDDRANRANPFQAVRSNNTKKIFLEGLKKADLVFYNGHSRFGGGPDFNPPKLSSKNFADPSYYLKHNHGTELMVKALSERAKASPDAPLDVMGIFSCASTKHFQSRIQATGVLKTITSTKLLHYSEAIKQSERALNKYLQKLSF